MRLADGTSTFTHGPDAVDGNGASYRYDPNAVPRKPVCSTGEAFKAVIAKAPDVVSNKTVASFRADIHAVNGIFHRAAVESGAPGGSDLKFRCDAAGNVLVDVVQLRTPNATATFASITSELKQLGYNKTNEKYAVHYDARPGTTSAGGTGSFYYDQTDSAANRNNSGAMWAVNFDNVPGTLLHEIGHNLGAVQKSAPNSTGSGSHCWEGYDVMCYNDGGDRDPGFIQYNCADFDHFDCRHDSYFDAKIGVGQGVSAGSYLDQNWNIGECYVKFVQHSACSTPTSDTTKPVIGAVDQQIALGYQISSTTVPVKLAWSASDASGIAAFELWMSTNGGAYVRDTSITTQTQKTYALTMGTSYRVAVRAKDPAGNWSDYSYSVPMTPGITNDQSVSGWTRFNLTGAFGGSYVAAKTAGSWFQFSFTGRDVALVAPKAPTLGRATLYCDGTSFGLIDEYAASTVTGQVVAWCHFPSSGLHTIKVVVEGTVSRPWFGVDAFATIT